MELTTIKMDKTAARKAFLDYRRAVHERHNTEDEQIMRGYRELARGRQLIRLSETIRAGGVTTIDVRYLAGGERRISRTTVPRLAVCRANVPMIWTSGIDRRGQFEVLMRRDISSRNTRDRLVFHGFEPVGDWGRTLRAIVPSVPPPLRPANHLRNYHVLFEAEWAPEPLPPIDPALLKRISGDLYAVVAVWDLTEIERAVLAARALPGS